MADASTLHLPEQKSTTGNQKAPQEAVPEMKIRTVTHKLQVSQCGQVRELKPVAVERGEGA